MSTRRPLALALALAAAGAVLAALPGAAGGPASTAAPERLTGVVEATTADGRDVATLHTVEEVVPGVPGAARVVASGPRAAAAVGARAVVTPYAFSSRNVLGAGHWDRCTTVRYWVNPAGMPAGALADVHTAVSRLAAASGTRFTYAGTTTVVPLSAGWLSTVPATHRSDVYLGWSDEKTVPGLAGSVAGLGGAYSTTPAGREPRLVLGGVVLDRAAALPAGFGAGATRGTLLLHELGHVGNLAHVDDPAQTMYPSISPSSPGDYQAGDRAGLGVLARQRCF